jgi:hypothetical protein
MISNDDNLANFTPSDIDNPEHVGTRVQHYLDLYELWQIGLDILERFDKDHSEYMARKRDLESALKLLRFRMERNYEERFYKDSINLNRQE